jgi:hypothetical protein
LGLRRLPMDITDQVTKAEIIWTLKVVDLNFSYKSINDLLPILRAMDPSSSLFKKMSLCRDKASYIIAYGLHPYFQKMVVRGIQKAPGYTLGTDAGTFKLHGLSKIVDCVFR